MEKGEKSKKYYEEINIIRGLTLLFVLIGHCFVYPPTENENYIVYFIYNFVYSFHMAVFFFISGFLASSKILSGKFDLKTETIKKARRILIPYFIVSIITFLIKLIMSDFARNDVKLSDFWKMFIGISPNGGMWFLYCLFVLSMIFMLFSKAKIRSRLFYVLFGLVAYIISLVPGVYLIRNLLKYCIFFALGIVFNSIYKFKLKKVILIDLAVISFLLLIIATIDQNNWYIYTGLLGIVFSFSIGLLLKNRKNFINKIVNELGQYSYDIYIISYFVMQMIMIIFYKMLNMNYYLVAVLTLIIGPTISYFLSKDVFRKNKILNKYLLGNWK